MHRIPFLVVIIFCLWAAHSNYKAEQRRAEMNPSHASIDRSAQSSRSTAAKQQQSIGYEEINATLETVARHFRNGVDVNGDGLTNCIDAAVLFYRHYPDKDKVSIILNNNPATGMNHLFNAVLIDGVWRAIEPQAFYGGHSNFFMRDIWGAKYDHNLNRNVTADYLRFVKYEE